MVFIKLTAFLSCHTKHCTSEPPTNSELFSPLLSFTFFKLSGNQVSLEHTFLSELVAIIELLFDFQITYI